MASSVFPSGVPSFLPQNSQTRIMLYYSVLDASFSEKVAKMFQSPISEVGKRTWKTKGKYASFKVMVHLHKFDSAPLASPYDSAKSIANLLLSYEDQDVSFYPFSGQLGSGLPLRKVASDNPALCHIANIDFDFLDKAGNTFDVCTITFIVNEFYDLKKLIITPEQLEPVQ